MLHRMLWEANQDLARACREHPFTRGLAAGDLPAERFRAYIAQDAFFLRAFLRAYAVTLGRLDATDDLLACHALIGGVLEELRLHDAYARELGLRLEETEPTPACRAYTDFLLRVAWQDGPALTAAAMTPCMRLYAELGRALAPSRRPGHPYERWLATYSDPEFEALATRLEALLDRWAADTPPVRDAYRYAMRCELRFFDDALEAPR